MLLVADIGNTHITLGIYKDDKLVDSWRLATDKDRSEDEYGIILKGLVNHVDLVEKLQGGMLSSVVLKLTDKFKAAIEKYLGIPVVVLSHKIDLGVKLDVENPKEVGADRVANAVAAYKFYKTPAVVVDFGTATTFDIVSEDGSFLGGVISPGINISAEALSSFTSRLPKVKIEAPPSVIGKNTIDNMLSGLVHGHAAMIDGIISAVEAELKTPVTTIATGGCSTIITDCLKRPFDHITPNLTLEGLRLIYQLNKENDSAKTLIDNVK